jgi:hypothetical protein
MTLFAGSQGRALVVPDLNAMAANAGVQPTDIGAGEVDLVQGALAWEVIASTLATGKNLQIALNAANVYIANIYPVLQYPTDQKRPVQAIFKIVGNPDICPRCRP